MLFNPKIHNLSRTTVSLWNAYGRRNVAAYDWNEIDNAPRAIEQWGTLPIFGLEFEFQAFLFQIHMLYGNQPVA